MADLDNKKKTAQENSFREEYEKNEKKVETEEQQKGFFARLWEGIQKMFKAIGDFLLALTHPDSVEYVSEEEMKKDNIDKHFNPTQNQEEEKEEIKDNLDIAAAIEQNGKENGSISFFQNDDVCKFSSNVEKQQLDVMSRLVGMMGFQLNESNKEYYAAYVANTVEIINKNSKKLEETFIARMNNSPQKIDFEIAIKLPKVVELFNKYAVELTGDESAVINDEMKDKFAKMYIEEAKNNFAKDIGVLYNSLENQPVKSNEIADEARRQWARVVAGEIDEKTAKENVLESTGVKEALKKQEMEKAGFEETNEQEPEVSEEGLVEETSAPMNYDGFDPSMMPEEISVSEEVLTEEAPVDKVVKPENFKAAEFLDEHTDVMDQSVVIEDDEPETHETPNVSHDDNEIGH